MPPWQPQRHWLYRVQRSQQIVMVKASSDAKNYSHTHTHVMMFPDLEKRRAFAAFVPYFKHLEQPHRYTFSTRKQSFSLFYQDGSPSYISDFLKRRLASEQIVGLFTLLYHVYVHGDTELYLYITAWTFHQSCSSIVYSGHVNKRHSTSPWLFSGCFP